MAIIPQINEESFNYYVFKELKQFQFNWDCYEIFPDEIISKIMVTIANISIHHNNICNCNETECIENWTMIMKYKKLDEDQNVIHCDGKYYDSDIDKYIYCHKIVLRNVERYRCNYCYKIVCEYCFISNNDMAYVDNLKFTEDQLDMLTDDEKSNMICVLCKDKIYPYVNFY